jgi:hypothetical protein
MYYVKKYFFLIFGRTYVKTVRFAEDIIDSWTV